jgi:hypothetical protein
MRMLQTVEFIVSGCCGPFNFDAGDIYEWVIVSECPEGCCYLLEILNYILQLPKDEIQEVVKFLNGVKV